MKKLDMIKAFAELEGLILINHKGGLCALQKDSDPIEFNPIADLALNCMLRDKYEVIIEYTNNYMTSEKNGIAKGYTEFNANHSISSKVCECILKSKGMYLSSPND